MFCFACFPGAGQMYMGMLRKGSALMLAFFGVVFLMGFFNLGFLGVFLPVLWFYAFFDTFNIRYMTYEEIKHADKEFLNGLSNTDTMQKFLKKKHKWVGIGCIVFGAYILYQEFLAPLVYSVNSPVLARMFNGIPTLCIGFLIVALGVWMVMGKKDKAYPKLPDFKEYGSNGGEKNDR